MTINKFRSFLYKLAKYLGDYNAIRKGKIKQRVKRRIFGKITGRMMGKIK